VDTNTPAVSLLRFVLSNDIHALLYGIVYFSQVVLQTRTEGTDRVQPVATTYNLLEAVCFYSGFLEPTIHSATIVIDDLRLPGLDGNTIFKQQSDSPGEFRVWYTTDASASKFPCRVCRVQEYTKDSNRLVDVDHTNPLVLDRVFRRYSMLLTNVIHTQSHQANTFAAHISTMYLAIDDPLRKLIDICTNSTPFPEELVAQKLFFNSAPTVTSFSPFRWLPTDTFDKFSKRVSGEDAFPVLQELYIRPLEMSYNSTQYLKSILPTSLIFTLSPALNARRMFNNIIRATCRRLQALSPSGKYMGRQDAVHAYNTSEIPTVRSMGSIRDGFDMFENVAMMVLQHH
jgi:hypothetical protein